MEEVVNRSYPTYLIYVIKYRVRRCQVGFVLTSPLKRSIIWPSPRIRPQYWRRWEGERFTIQIAKLLYWASFNPCGAILKLGAFFTL